MNFLIIGGGGYLGSVLVPLLLKRGHNCLVADRFFWGKETLPFHSRLVLLEIDSRKLTKEHFNEIDVVIDLAALSNDPTAQLNPKITLEINHQARVKNASLAKRAGVKKYILASSCSVYGFQKDICAENTSCSPVTIYAKASLMAENDVLNFSDDKFCVTVLRQSTLYGLSPRMRFDLVVNTMTLSLFRHKIINVEDGSQWRPVLHVNDSSEAFIKISQANPKKINGQIFNVGSDNQNYKIKNLAEDIKKILNPLATIAIDKTKIDARSYRVSFAKIKNILGFETKFTLEETVTDLNQKLSLGQVSCAIQTQTIDWYKYLLSKNPHIFYV